MTLPAELNLDFDNLDRLEIQLIDLALELSAEDDPNIKAMARAIKAFTPAWVTFVDGERQRNDSYGPSASIRGLCRTFAMLMAFLSVYCAKGGRQVALAKYASDEFRNDLCNLAAIMASKEAKNAKATD